MQSILVIDDELIVLDMLSQFLLKFGFEVETATNGENGIKKFNSGNFDIVITDIIMPGLDGNSVAEYIRNSQKKSTPIIAISGTPEQIKKEFFNTVMQKPFPMETIINNIKELIAA